MSEVDAEDYQGLTKEQIEKLGEEVEKHPIMNPRRLRKRRKSGLKTEVVIIVVVGFKASAENSVYYQKIHHPTPEDVGLALWKAFLKGADFASVRFIKKEVENCLRLKESSF